MTDHPDDIPDSFFERTKMNKRLEEIRDRAERMRSLYGSGSHTPVTWDLTELVIDVFALLREVDTQAGILDEREKFIVKLGNELTDAAKEVSKLDKQIAEGVDIVTEAKRYVADLHPIHSRIDAWLKAVSDG